MRWGQGTEPLTKSRVNAHNQRAMKRCEGELVREGRLFELRNPRSIEFFGLVEEPRAAP